MLPAFLCSPALLPIPNRRWQVSVFFALFLGVGAAAWNQYDPYTFFHGDGAFYATMNRSILEGTLEQRAFQPTSWYEKPMGWNNHLDQGWSNVSMGHDGRWWPKHPILLPIVGTPLYWLLGPVGALWTNMLLLVLGLWYAARLAARVADPSVVALCAMGFTTLPIVTHSAYAYSNDVLYGFLCVAGVEAFVGESFLLCGLFLGLAVWCKPTVALIPGLLGLSLLVRKQWRHAGLVVLGGLPGLLAIAVQNTWMFGSPFTFSYDRIIVTRQGQPALEAAGVKMHRPLTEGLKSVWQDEGQGLTRQITWGLGGLAGTPLLIRALPVAGVTFLVSLGGFFLFYAKYEYTYARFYLPWLFLSLAPLAQLVSAGVASVAWLTERPRWLTFSLAFLVATVVSVSVAVSRRPVEAWSASRAITHAVVTRGQGPGATPCDYYNPRWQKWECSQVDYEPWLTWGVARKGECEFAGEPAPWLWLHPNPGVSRQITFAGVPNGPLTLRYGLAPKSRFSGLKFTLASGPANARVQEELTVPDIGKVHDLVIPTHGGTWTLTVPEQVSEWRQLCIQATIP